MERKIKVIIVDDNNEFVNGIKLILEKQNHIEITGTASNGFELLKHPELGHANIILLDIEMPGLNGFDVAKEINWSYPHIKLIATTMYQEKVYLEK